MTWIARRVGWRLARWLVPLVLATAARIVAEQLEARKPSPQIR